MGKSHQSNWLGLRWEGATIHLTHGCFPNALHVMLLRLCRTSGMTFAEAMIIISIVVMLVAIAIPNFVKARISTSIHSCKYNLMWMEYAKEDWTRQTQASAGAQILDRDLIAAMNRVRPRWDGREQ